VGRPKEKNSTIKKGNAYFEEQIGENKGKKQKKYTRATQQGPQGGNKLGGESPIREN